MPDRLEATKPKSKEEVMFIKLHDHMGAVHLINPRHIVDINPTPASRIDAKCRVLMVNMTLFAKESMGEIYTLCNGCVNGYHASELLDEDLSHPYGAESLSPDWVKAVDAQIRKE